MYVMYNTVDVSVEDYVKDVFITWLPSGLLCT